MVCTHTRQFLDAYLKGDARAAEFLQRSAAGYGTDTERFSLRRLEAAPLPPTGKQLAELALEEGVDAALALCASLGTDLREDLLNGAGHGLLRQGRSMDAIPLFARAVELYPSSVTAHESLGEAYAAAGDTLAAIRYYERVAGLLSDEVMAADESASERISERLGGVCEVLERLRDQRGTGWWKGHTRVVGLRFTYWRTYRAHGILPKLTSLGKLQFCFRWNISAFLTVLTALRAASESLQVNTPCGGVSSLQTMEARH